MKHLNEEKSQDELDKILNSWNSIDRISAPDDLEIDLPGPEKSYIPILRWAAILLVVIVNISVWYLSSSNQEDQIENQYSLYSYTYLQTFETDIFE